MESVVWQNGVLLSSTLFDARALIRTDYAERWLTFYIIGAQASRYLSILYHNIKSILARMPDLQYSEVLGLTDDMRIGENPRRLVTQKRGPVTWANFRQLLAMEAAGQNPYIDENGVFFDLSKVLHVMPDSDRARYAPATININMAIANRDMNIAQVSNVPHAEVAIASRERTIIKGAKAVAVGRRDVTFTQWEIQTIEQIKKEAYDLLRNLRDIAFDEGFEYQNEDISVDISRLIEEIETASKKHRSSLRERIASYGKQLKEKTGFLYRVLHKTADAGENIDWWISKIDLITRLLSQTFSTLGETITRETCGFRSLRVHLPG